MKLVLADGYYQISLSAPGVLQLGVIMPTPKGHEPLLAFLITLNKLPPFFCVFTETMADLCNRQLQQNIRQPTNPLEDRVNSHGKSLSQPMAVLTNQKFWGHIIDALQKAFSLG